jgi:microcin C transport system ATP-binding protein
MSVLTISNLSATFKSNGKQALRGVSLTLEQGEMLGIVGESGSGKSVTAQSIMRLLSHEQIRYDSGTIMFAGKDLLTLSRQEMREIRGKHIAMVFQEPMSALNPLHTIGKQISEAITIHQNLSKTQVKEQVLALLAEVELSSFVSRLDAYPHQLSGGERQRVMIAMALANKPNILIADEPTTALDVHVQEQIIALLQRLQQRHKMTIMFISHDLTLVHRIASRVVIMKSGEIVEHGNTREVFHSPQHAYTKKLLSSTPSGNPAALDTSSQELLKLNAISADFTLKRNWLGKSILEKKALNNISFTLRQGETLGIVGESGSGKTTLANAILKLIPCTGDMRFDNTDMQALSKIELRSFRRNVQCVFQDPFSSLNPRLTIGFIISEGLRVHHPELTESDINTRVFDMMESVGLDKEMATRYPHEFSGGQRQRISIARAMILKPKLLILDEPTSALDLSLQAQILELLRELQTKTKTSYIFISHDLRVIRALAHQIIVLKSGEIVEHGDWLTLSTAPKSDYTKLLMKAAFANAPDELTE